MNTALGIDSIQGLAQALGLVDDQGQVRAAWFSDPLGELEAVFRDADRRTALGNFLDEVIPGPSSDRAGWHPLLWDGDSAPALGNLFLTLEDGGLVGIAGELHTSIDGLAIAVTAQVPLLQFDADVHAVVATSAHPIELSLDVDLPPAPEADVELHEIALTLRIALVDAVSVTPRLELHGFRIGTTTRDHVLDLGDLAGSAVDLAIALLQAAVDKAPEPFKSHLLPVVGLAATGPQLPILALADDPDALGRWLRDFMEDAGAAHDWFAHFTALVTGQAALPTITGTARRGDPLRGRLFGAEQVEVDLTLAVADNKLYPGVAVAVGPSSAVQLALDLLPVGIPLRGGDPELLPQASVVVRSFEPLVDTADVGVRQIRAGVDFAGGQVHPVVQLLDVRLAGQQYPEVNLTHVDELGQLASHAVEALLRSALGDGPGVHALALLGITDAVPQALDLVKFLTDPLGAVAAFHRAVLLDASPGWGAILGELAALIAPGATVDGTGTQTDPWWFAVAPTPAPLSIRAVAWKAGDVELHLGLALQLSEGPFRARVVLELLRLDAPASGAPGFAVFHEHSAEIALAPPPQVRVSDSLLAQASEAAVGIDWRLGGVPNLEAHVSDVALTIDGTALPAFTVRFPSSPPDASSASSIATGLGVGTGDPAGALDQIARVALVQAAERWGGQLGVAVASLFGLHGGEFGLPDDAPLLAASLVDNPLTAARAWLHQVATGVSTSGGSFAERWLGLLGSAANDRLAAPATAPSVLGSGTADDPWRVAFDLGRTLELLVWLTPGPAPAALAAHLAHAHESVDDFAASVLSLRGLMPDLNTAVDALDGPRLAQGVRELDAFFAVSDGIVPLASAAPPIAGVDARPPFAATHLGLLAHAGAIAAVRAEAGVPTLLVSAPFADATCWTALLGGSAAAHFDFRLDGTPPDRVDTGVVQDVVDFYTVDLAGDDVDSQTAQLGRVLDRLATLHPSHAVTIVAHSVSGHAAVRVASAQPTRVAKVVTVGTPHAGAVPPYFSSAPAGVALRAARGLLTAVRSGNATLASALDQSLAAVEGVAPPDGVGVIELDALRAASDAPGTVPIVAIAGRLGSGLLATLGTALRTTAPTPADPDAVHFGVSLALDPRAPTSMLSVETALRFDLGRIGLANATLDAGERRFGAVIRIERPDGWVLGGAGTQHDGTAWPARIRRAELSCLYDGTALSTRAKLVDASLAAPARTLELDDPQTPQLLDALFATLSTDAAAAKLIAALRQVGIVLSDAPRVASDALAALRSDGHSWLAPRVRTAIASGTFYGQDAGGWDPGAHAIQISFDGSGLVVHADDAANLGVHADLTLDPSSLALSGTATLDAGGLEIVWHPGGVSLRVERWLDDLPVWPLPDAATWRSRAAEVLPRLLLAVASEAVLGPVLPVRGSWPPLDSILTGRQLPSLDSLGLNASGVAYLLRRLNGALGQPDADGLSIPPAFLIGARQDGDAAVLSLATTQAIGGVLGVDLHLTFTGGMNVAPGGTLSLGIPGGTWQGVHLEISVDGSGVGVALVVGTGPSAVHVTFLPSFSGWASLIAGGVALLPYALDQIRTAVPDSVGKQRVLAVAQAFDLYDGTSFAARTSRFSDIAQHGLSYDVTLRREILQAVVALFGAGSPWSLPGSSFALHSGSSGPEPVIEWDFTPGGWAEALRVVFDWTNDVPEIELGGTLLVTAADGVAIAVGLDAAIRDPVDVTAFVELRNPIGMGISPRIELGVSSASGTLTPALRLLPLHHTGDALADEALALALLPAPALTPPNAERLGLTLGLDVLLPLVTFVLEQERGTDALWNGGPTLTALVNGSGLFTPAPNRRLADPLPSVTTVLANLAGALSASFSLGDLTFTFGGIDGAGHEIGFALQGEVEIPIDSVALKLLFGEKSPGTDRVEVAVFQRASDWQFAPLLRAEHFGVGVAGAEGAPLISNDSFRLGTIEAFTWFDVDFIAGSGTFDGAGAAVENLGISLGTASGGDNAIAKSMLKGASSGDGAPAQPGFGIEVSYRQSAGLDVQLKSDDPRKAWFGIRAKFGPLYIDQLGVELERVHDPNWIAILIDGGVTVGGFAAAVEDLAIRIPVHDIHDPNNWGIDLGGLAVAYSGGGVSVLGALLRNEVEGGVEYDGMLIIKLDTIGIAAIGAWAKLVDAQGQFDSLFVFAAAFVTISFPPYFELQGIGAGFGYNRALVVPTDMNAVPDFPLVAVLDDPSLLSDNPMSALDAMKTALPARRGSLWFAAGIRGALFVVVDVVAVVYVALDSHFEIGVLGVGRLAQPEGSPIVSIELAVKARYSSAEGVLSIQAQLTDNSWLLTPDCQLTGGFALFIWFPRGQFVLTIGGYHPSFQPEPEFPIVPRLGFRLDLYGVIHIKGESYFALTNSCVMAGVRLEAAYDIGWLRAWFEAWADFLLSWDPFHYDISIGVRLGVDFNLDIDLLFGTISIHFSFSIGASLRLVGPPLHGEVTANLGPIELTVPFGDTESGKPNGLPWAQFKTRYLLSNDSSSLPVTAQPENGMIPPDGDASPPDGTSDKPWRFAAEFRISSRTSMPASKYQGPVGDVIDADGVDLDIAPMYEASVDSTHQLVIEGRDGSALTLDPDRFPVTLRMGDFPEAVWRYTGSDTPNAAARNVSGLAGLTLDAVPEVSPNHTGEIDVAHLVDEGAPRPLPFLAQTPEWQNQTKNTGAAADAFAQRWAGTNPQLLLEDGSPAHENLGIKRPSTSPRSLAALGRRVSPPRIAPLSEGLTLKPPGRGVPALVPKPEDPPPPPRDPKLGYASRFAAAAAIAVAATSARSAQGLPRMAPPRAVATSVGRLVRVGSGIPSTMLAGGTPGLSKGPAARSRLGQVESVAREKGVSLAAGAVHTWELVPGDRWTLIVSGDAARVATFGRGGRPLTDEEFAAAGPVSIAIPADAVRVVVWSLGKCLHTVERGFGAVSIAVGASTPIAVGWHQRSLVHVIDGVRALGRGASLRLSVAGRAGLVRAAQAVGDAATVETRLPAAVGAVLVLTAPSLAGLGVNPKEPEIAVAVAGATSGDPLLFDGDTGQAALYPVSAQQPFTLTVTSSDAWRIAGVIGLRGRASELAVSLHERSFADLVGDPSLTADGGVSIRFQRGTQ